MTGPDRDVGDRFTAVRTRIVELARTVREAGRGILLEEELRRLDEAVARLAEGRLHVVVVGEFKRGKSSLLNAVVGRRGLFPVDEDITTSIVTSVSYGWQEEAVVHSDDATVPTTVSIAEAREYVTERANPGNQKRVRLVELRGPFPSLAPGITLVDTPGVGGVNLDHAAATMAILRSADAVIVVTDAVEPLTAQELKFLDSVMDVTRNTIFAVTKIDRVDDPSVMVDNTRQKVSTRYRLDPKESVIVPVSSARKLDGIDENDPDLVAKSGFGVLEEQLWQILTARAGAELALHTSTAVRQALDHIVLPQRAELAAIRTPNGEDGRRLQAEYERARERLQKLADDTAPWRSRLTAAFDTLERDSVAGFDAMVAAVDDDLRNVWLSRPELIVAPDELARKVIAGLVQALSKLTEHLEERTRTIYADAERALRLDLEAPEIERITFESMSWAGPPPRQGREHRTLVQKAYRMVGTGRAHGTCGAVVGAFAGTAVGALFGGVGAYPGYVVGHVLGAAIGGIFGTTEGLRSGARSIREDELAEQRDELAQLFGNFLEANRRRAGEARAEALRRLRLTVPDELDARIESELATVSKSLDGLRAGESVRQDAAARQAELRASIAPLDDLATSLTKAEEEVLRLAETTKGAANSAQGTVCYDA
jgi:GTP-binding protein EngB required for normal cell division